MLLIKGPLFTHILICPADAHISAAKGFLERIAPKLAAPKRARNGGCYGAEPPLLAATLGSLADVAQECLSQACAHLPAHAPLDVSLL